MSEESVRETLRGLLQKLGPELINDARRCEGMLRDLCPTDRREVNLLVLALKEGVAAELREGGRGSADNVDRAVRKLEQNLGLSSESARWTVESWAQALGLSPSLTHLQATHQAVDRGAPQAESPPSAPGADFYVNPYSKLLDSPEWVRQDALRVIRILSVVLVMLAAGWIGLVRWGLGREITFPILFALFIATASVSLVFIRKLIQLKTGEWIP